MTTASKENTHTSFIASFRKAETAHSQLPVKIAAKEAVEKLEIPTTKWEAWKYTRLKPIVDLQYNLDVASKLESVQPFLIEGLEADLLVFINGKFNSEFSRIELNKGKLNVSSFSELNERALENFSKEFGSLASSDKDVFTALNTAYGEEGVWIHLADNVHGAPIHILHLTTSEAGSNVGVQHRNVFKAGKNSQIEIFESTYTVGNTQDKSFRNQVTEIHVSAQARVQYIKLQQEADTASQIDSTVAHVDSDAHFSIYTFTFSGAVVRNNLHISLIGSNSEAHLMGAYLLDGIQHVDNHTQVDHAVPHCFSNELYKGIMHDRSTGVFNGRIHVFPDAQKTNAFQSNRNILLSPNANIFTKPQLEIYADDVKCSHGATTGRLDESALFYLRARGIKETEARKLLIQAFAAETLEGIKLEAVHQHLLMLIEKRY